MGKKERPLESFFNDFQNSFDDLYDQAHDDKIALDSSDEVNQFKTHLQQTRYLDEQHLAEGGMKNISKGNDSVTSRDVAIAYLKESQQDHFSDFIKEARLNARLQHPNIMTVYDIGIDDENQAYFTMKLIEGEELGTIIKRLKRAQEPEYNSQKMLYIFLKICEAIAFAHSKNILHLDLKPENIQIGNFGEVLVCDWGLAKDLRHVTTEINESDILANIDNLDLSISSTLDGVVKGSPGYMSPEQASGRNSEKDERTDVYCLGAILYSMLTYQAPISFTNIHAALKKCIIGAIPRPSVCASAPVPEALEAVTLKAMAVKPEDRYQSVQELISDIEAYMGGFATSAEHADFLTQIKLLIKRNKIASRLIAYATISIITLTILFMFQLKESETQARRAQVHAELAKSEAEEAQESAETENRLRLELSKKAAPAFFRRAQLTYRNYQFDACENALKLAVELDPKATKAWSLLGLIHLGKLDFKAAKAALQQGSPDTELAYIELINKWGEVEINESKMAVIISEFKNFNLNREIALLISTFNKGKNFSQKMALIETVLQSTKYKGSSLLMNESAASLTIKGNKFNLLAILANTQLKKLDISNTVVTDVKIFTNWKLNELNISHTKISDIESLKKNPIHTLDISYTPINDINVLQSLPLKSLNIAGLRIKNLAPLLNCKSLKKLTLSQDIAEREHNVIRALQERCQVIILP